MGYLYCCIVGTGRQQTADSLAGYTRVSKDGKLGAFIRALRAWEGSGGGGPPPPPNRKVWLGQGSWNLSITVYCLLRCNKVTDPFTGRKALCIDPAPLTDVLIRVQDDSFYGRRNDESLYGGEIS